MTLLSAAQLSEIESRYPDVFHQPLLKRSLPLLIVLGTLLYVAYCWWFFAIGTVIAGGQWDRAEIYARQWYSYDLRPTIRFSGDDAKVTWPRFSPLGDNPNPDWLVQDGRKVTVDFGSAGRIVADAKLVEIEHRGEKLTVVVEPTGAKPQGELPAWATLREDEVKADFGFAGEVRIMPERVSLSRRFLGWPNFLFDPRSPFWGKPLTEVAGLIVSGDRIKPEMSNAALAFDNIWNNSQWQHGDVWTKLLQTIVMAFVGTLFASFVALPLAFIAARNITPSFLANQATKRFFDFLRSVDMLIWALFFTRAFGPGPLAGISAIFFTDTGTLGKVYSETLENIDDKQREGVRSVGASPVVVQRYGVAPQVLPVFLSQALYFWESNTRSATIIGAVGAGGIGLKLWEAMRTNSNWSNVAYMVLLILIVVFIFDNISNALRRRLMEGSAGR
ncbi:phosphonate ABC transporter, permease protein PhnE [Pseudaminobacter soli (ex Li et al. 2025)]|uniref:Phosphonate ABC transporter, permease protein PhnE n=1 Tax=Pseudaminobacter soli (ex Li et al. 2025) TaxID=1295366 RepID=A0A2P7S4C4_9HYPH|nr:phosphonate ABC transporter, permease protein PhnE [Mesorhizobium soli]PSJ57320.1 phosphonate ABC transporter, permease protein PhnE [Mesorhizobium soli]